MMSFAPKDMKRQFVLILSILSITFIGSELSAQFKAVDTSRVQGSPDPLPPLEIVNAFPHLKFARPVGITHAGDGSGRSFVIDQVGIIHVFKTSEDTKESKVFLDIRKKVLTDHFEEGLLGLAFHPKYKETGEFFVYYSANKPRRSVISRFKVSSSDPNKADPNSEELVIAVNQPFGNHNSGSIEFGPDGKLYIPLGDGGAGGDPHGNGQNLSTLLGTIIRIDIDKKDAGKNYAIPPDNPFVGREGARGEIWVYGVRNPWRMTFDRLTGEGWFADVGQNQREEINLIRKGGNYGWKVREGTLPFDASAKSTGETFIPPLSEYARHDGKSISGGLVYRGKKFGELKGTYLYADFASYNIWALKKSGARVTSNILISRSSLPVTGFGEDEAGEIYIAAFGGGEGFNAKKVGMGKLFHLGNGKIYKFKRRTKNLNDPARFPRLLSQTGFFKQNKLQTPIDGLIPYDVNIPQWTDGARKSRYLALPSKGSVKFSEHGNWEFPVGSVFIETLSMGDKGNSKKLETRLLVLSDRGWDGYTYKWNDTQTDAELLDSGEVTAHTFKRDGKDHNQSWNYPSRSDCNTCHNQSAGYVLGVNTKQLNSSSSKNNPLDQFHQLGVLTEDLPKELGELPSFPNWNNKIGSVDKLARGYLDVNCSICHRPGGTAVSRADFRSGANLKKARILNQDPGQARFGADGSKIITPGAPSRSEMVLRMMHLGTGRMPPLATTQVDWNAVQIVGQWIESMQTE